MPKVGSKHFPYTKLGMKQAEMESHMKGKPVVNRKPRAKKGKARRGR